MNRHKMKISDKALAALLAVILAVNLLPAALYASEIEEPPTVEKGVSDAETLPGTEVKTKTVTVEATGSGMIKLNGTEQESLTVDQDAIITIEVLPVDVDSHKSYIKSLSINGEKQDVEKYASYENLSYSVTEDIVIEAAFATEYAISGKSGTGGKILFNSQPLTEESMVVDEGTTVNVQVLPEERYQIKSVKINGAEEAVSDASAYARDIALNQDILIEAEFERVYTLTVTCDGTNGTVTTAPSCEGGSVNVVEGSGISVTATPNANYRVSKVIKNGEEQLLGRAELTEKTKNNYVYSDTSIASVNQDYTYEIEFALNYYQISAVGTEHGKVSLSPSGDVVNLEVDHGSCAAVTIIPEGTYRVKSILLKTQETPEGTAVDLVNDENYVENPDHTSTYRLTDITGDCQVEVEFEEMTRGDDNFEAYVTSRANAGELKNHYINEEGDFVYVYSKDGEVVLKPASPYDQISLRYEGEETYGDWTASETVKESCKITSLRVRTGKKQNAVCVLSEKKVRFILDHGTPELSLMPENPHKNGYYNKDFTVDVSAWDVVEGNAFSGIAKVEYQVSCGASLEDIEKNETQTGVLYEAAEGEAGIEIYGKGTYEDYQPISLDANANNSDFVRLSVTVTDWSGNSVTKTEDVKINTTVPKVKVEMNGSANKEAKDGYYTSRTATITVTDRGSAFDAQAILEGLAIQATNYDGDEITVNKAAMLSEWTLKEKKDQEEIYMATLEFKTDANYQWSLNYENKAGNHVNGIDTVGDHIWEFTVDTKAPREENTSITLNTSVWNKLLSALTFGIFANKSVSAVAVSKDDISPVEPEDIKYYKSNEYKALTAEDLERLYADGRFSQDEISVDSDEAFVIYARIMDAAGNVLYISTNGVIVDLSQAVVELTKREANQNGFYNSDVEIGILVNEKVALDKKFSGIKKVDYAVTCDGTTTQEGNLYTFESEEPSKTVNETGEVTMDPDTGVPETFRDTIVVDSKKNNGDHVQVTITAEDQAGNLTVKESEFFSICITKPTCSVTFEDQANRLENDYGWYGRKRTATVVITDRESVFDAKAAAEGIVILGKNARGESIKLDKTEISWSTDPNDNSRHIATVVFEDSAKYEWSISYDNKADLGFTWEEAKKIGESVSKFTVDQDDPRGTVSVGVNLWDKLLNNLTFGLYSKKTIDVKAEAEDDTSPVKVQYYKTSNPVAMEKKELDKQKFKDYQDFSITAPEQFVIYLKITDYAGNYIYINSDGVIVDQEASQITLTKEKPNENKIYNKDVTIAVKVEEPKPYAGIKTIEYWVESDGKETQRQILYSFDYVRDSGDNSNGGTLTITDWATGEEVKSKYEGEVPTQSQLKREWNGNIVVNAKKNNNSDVKVYVRTEDNAGNTGTDSVRLDIDITRPEITVSYDNNSDNGGTGYFAKNRTATVEIRERVNHFNKAKASEGIQIKAVDVKGNDVEIDKIISNWETTVGAAPDDTIHKATISYHADANYTFSISYTDEAGNVNQKVNTGSSVAPYRFTVDKNAPTGTITSKTEEGRSDTFSRLASRLTFGIWSKDKITISAAAEDATSPVSSVEYYQTSDTQAMTKKELNDITEWKNFKTYSVKAQQQFAVYLKITDKAGNISYISTNGMIVDSTDPRTESIAPEVSISPEQPVNGIYNRDVRVDIKVQDPKVHGVYSGLKTVSYRVLNMGNETQSGMLYQLDQTDPTKSELRPNWSGSITVDSALNNSNDVVIEVFVEDNARNSSTGTESIKIDVTKPEITVRYDNNSPDSEKYYKESRTATIVVNERNFDPKDIVVSITNTDGVIPSLSAWSSGTGDGNLDNTPHTATITYDADGDYTFDINYMDLAKNVCDGENYAAGTANGTEFIIDKIAPVINVSYDNNDAAGGRYFKKNRIATVTVEEHNFDVSRVQFTQTASLNGASIPAPAPSWSEHGDVHTATIVYDADGDYTFDVTMTDMAGNESGQANYDSGAASKEFTVDTKIEKPVISGVENGKAYKDQVVPTIDFSDINYSDYSIELTRTRKDEIDKDVTDQFIKTMDISAEGGSGANNTFDMIQENDGIYNLKVQCSDMAGNEEEETVTFTLNRFGSVYAYNDYLVSLIEDGGAYVKGVDQEIEITEYNADKLVDGSLAIQVTRDGKPIEEIEYKVSPEINDKVQVGESGWYQYGYRISPDNFKDDGVYKMTVSSKDQTGNTPENTNYKDQEILFRVDSTAPEITSVTGLENEVVNAVDVEVAYTVYDTIGLKSVEARVNGKTVGEKITEFGEDKNNYSGSFTLKESDSAQEVQLIVYDMAGNCTDTNAKDFGSAYAFHPWVTVSTNFFVRWYADKPLFWGCIGGGAAAVAIVAGVMTLLLRKRKARAHQES